MDTILLVTFVLMSALFLRQLILLKHFTKINYAALQLSIALFGALLYVASTLTFDMWQRTIANALYVVAAGVLFYMVMNIIDQLRNRYLYEIREKKLQDIEEKNSTTREQMQELFHGLQWLKESDSASQDLNEVQRQEEALNFASIIKNQQGFIRDVSLLLEQNENAEKQLHALFEQFKQELLKEVQTQQQDQQASWQKQDTHWENFKQEVASMLQQPAIEKTMSASFQKSIEAFNQKLLGSFKEYEKMVQSLRIQNESFQTALSEDEQRLASIKGHSEQLMQQMVLSKNAMQKQADALKKQGHTYAQMHEQVNVLYQHIQKAIETIDNLDKSDTFKAALHDAVQPFKVEQTALLQQLQTTLIEQLEAHIQEVEKQFGYVNDQISSSVRTLSQKSRQNPYEQ